VERYWSYGDTAIWNPKILAEKAWSEEQRQAAKDRFLEGGD
jgi:hypothetical protein